MSLPAAAAGPSDHARGGRFAVIDVARGAALLAMAGYHATWDLGFLRLTPENHALSGPGKVAAHLIAGSFLVLVGIGLVLMNRSGLRPRAILIRFGRIAGAALLITVATVLAFPDSYIFFGILHCIAVSSLLALPFLRVPPAITATVAALVIAAPRLVAHPVLDAPALFFLGLGRLTPQTNDYVPLFPWFGTVLAGLALGQVALPVLARSRLGAWHPRTPIARAAALAGRHSLAIYLVHQPLLLAVLSGVAFVTGPNLKAGMPEFRRDYAANCIRTGGSPGACRIAARCTADALRRDKLWAFAPRAFTPAEQLEAQRLSQQCYEASEGTAAPPP
ncbi:heparan-alpha-glucosaminide N-acetyltransferase [Methylobacterium sp. sgz302541]|uniref:heparan-alpha-glucosaminide N-acetyltransferase n=1 Tax=unclassified Methylobacterium TaxID=2615210 RepID=UPI003D33CDB1